MQTPWRDAARPVRLWAFDARLVLFAAFWVLWPAWWTTAATAAAWLAFRIAEARGYRLPAACRAIRVRLAGRRPALYRHRIRRFADYG